MEFSRWKLLCYAWAYNFSWTSIWILSLSDNYFTHLSAMHHHQLFEFKPTQANSIKLKCLCVDFEFFFIKCVAKKHRYLLSIPLQSSSSIGKKTCFLLFLININLLSFSTAIWMSVSVWCAIMQWFDYRFTRAHLTSSKKLVTIIYRVVAINYKQNVYYI